MSQVASFKIWRRLLGTVMEARQGFPAPSSANTGRQAEPVSPVLAPPRPPASHRGYRGLLGGGEWKQLTPSEGVVGGGEGRPIRSGLQQCLPSDSVTQPLLLNSQTHDETCYGSALRHNSEDNALWCQGERVRVARERLEEKAGPEEGSPLQPAPHMAQR